MKKILLVLAILISISGKISLAQCNSAFTYNFNPPNTGLVDFLDSSYGTSGPITYSWDFGVGVSGSNIPNLTVSYQYNGPYNVCLIISDSTGCVDTTCQLVTVTGISPVMNVYVDFDTNIVYCTYPAQVDYYYYLSVSNYPNTDTVFTCTINFDDGTDTTFDIIAFNTSQTGIISHEYINGGSYIAHITAIAANLDSSSVSTLYPLFIYSTCGPLSGTVYNDLNSNCTFDSGEELAGISLYIYNGTQFISATTSNINGLYSFNVPAGPLYDVHINTNNGFSTHFTPTCPPSGIVTDSVPSSGNDIGVICPTGTDLQGYVTGFHMRPGFIALVCVSAFNQYCSTPSGEIDLVFPPDLTPLPDTSGIGYTLNGDTLIYPISSANLDWSFCIPVLVSLNAQIGDTACIGMIILPIIGDSVPSNNTGTFCLPITNSYDPNDKSVNPSGDGSQGFVLPSASLVYTIRFQNTGNADAINIFILDTLSQNLDATSVELIGSSFPATMSLLAGNILRFNFDNINLADSNSNEPNSHGYVTYRIKQINNILQSAVINNTAGIYFDFNPPVITNTTTNTVDYFLSVPVIKNGSSLINVYPNPANDKCQLYFSNNHPHIISVTDILGKELYRIKTTSDSFILNTMNFSEGIYSIHLFEENGNTDSYKLLIAR